MGSQPAPRISIEESKDLQERLAKVPWVDFIWVSCPWVSLIWVFSLSVCLVCMYAFGASEQGRNLGRVQAMLFGKWPFFTSSLLWGSISLTLGSSWLPHLSVLVLGVACFTRWSCFGAGGFVALFMRQGISVWSSPRNSCVKTLTCAHVWVSRCACLWAVGGWRDCVLQQRAARNTTRVAAVGKSWHDHEPWQVTRNFSGELNKEQRTAGMHFLLAFELLIASKDF